MLQRPPLRPTRNLRQLLLVLLLAAAHWGTGQQQQHASMASAAATASTSDEQELEQLRLRVQQQPGNALAHVQLALALQELNHAKPDGGSRVPEAVRAYRAALALVDPRGEQASAYMHVQGNLGALLLSADRPAAAITELQAALTLGKALATRLRKRLRRKAGTKKQQQQQQQQQRVLLQEELEGVQQQLGGLMFNMGKALASLGRLEEADAVFAEAAAAAFGHEFSSYGKALAAAHTVPAEAVQQATVVAEQARRHFSAQPELQWLGSVALDAHAAAGAAAEPPQQQQQQQQQEPGPWISSAKSVDLVWLHFALHRHHHSHKRYDLAWQYLDLGNRIMASLVGYDKAVDERNLMHLQRIFRAPWTTSGLEDQTALFVVGMPRSGSTLVEQMLASHSQVYAAGEDTALAPLTADINKALAAAPSQDQPALLQHYGRLYLSRMQARVPQDWAAAKAPPQQQPQQPQQQQQEGDTPPPPAPQQQQPSRIVDKMLRNLWLIGYIHMLLPRACIVHVVRHPLDVALSCYAQPFGYSAAALAWTWDLGAIAQQLHMAWSLAEHWEGQLPSGRVHTVFYEELVERPQMVAERLLSACGLEWEPQVLQFQDTNRSVHTASMVQVRQPLFKTSVGRWRAYERKLGAVREALAPLIEKYDQLLAQRMAAGEGGSQAGRQLVQEQQQQQQHAEPDVAVQLTVKDEL